MITIAYIDPGTGAIALQVLIAGIAATAFFFRNMIARMLGIGKKKGEDSGESEE